MNTDYIKVIKSNFLAFCIYITNGKFKTPRHIIEICELLDKLEKGKINRLIISLPPRMGKSYLSSILFPAYLLGRDSETKIIASTYGFDLSKNFSKRLINIISSERYQELFPNTKLVNTGRSTSIWDTTMGGYYKSTSRGSAITGLSANYIIADDLIKNSLEAKSPSLLKNIKEWWWSTLYSRLTKKSNGEEGKVLILMTRWNKDDLIGHLLDGNKEGDWVYFNYPALDANDNALWEEMQSKKLLLDIRERDPETFSCLYQGQPGAMGSTEFNLGDYTIYPVTHEFSEKREFYFSSWDTASKISDNNDYTVGILFSIRRNKLFLEDYVRGKFTLPELYKLVEEKNNTWDCKFNLIEDASSGTGLIQLFNNSSRVKCIGITPNVKKKLPSVVPLLCCGDIILKNYDDITRELSEFPYVENDDAVSAFVNGAWYYATKLRRENQKTFSAKKISIKPRKELSYGSSNF